MYIGKRKGDVSGRVTAQWRRRWGVARSSEEAREGGSISEGLAAYRTGPPSIPQPDEHDPAPHISALHTACTCTRPDGMDLGCSGHPEGFFPLPQCRKTCG
eukprot:4799163-Prymnesium_polylepis.1